MPLEGSKELQADLQKYAKTAEAAFGAAIYEEAVEIIGGADENVPYEYGHLRRSHYVMPPAQGPSGTEVELGYGAGYGLYVHEIPANHPKGGKDHWLRDEMVKRQAGMAERLAKRTEAHIAAGSGFQSLGVPSERPDPMDAINAERADRERARRRARAAGIRAQNAARARRAR
jgi:hypothetical protein